MIRGKRCDYEEGRSIFVGRSDDDEDVYIKFIRPAEDGDDPSEIEDGKFPTRIKISEDAAVALLATLAGVLNYESGLEK